MADNVFDSAIMLKSEHTRILASAQARYDALLKERERSGFWRGFAEAAFVGGAGMCGVAIAAFTFGVWCVQ